MIITVVINKETHMFRIYYVPSLILSTQHIFSGVLELASTSLQTVIMHNSSQVCIQWPHIGSLKSGMVVYLHHEKQQIQIRTFHPESQSLNITGIKPDFYKTEYSLLVS